MWMVPLTGNFVLVIFGDGKKKFPNYYWLLVPPKCKTWYPVFQEQHTAVVYPTVAEKNKREEDPKSW